MEAMIYSSSRRMPGSRIFNGLDAGLRRHDDLPILKTALLLGLLFLSGCSSIEPWVKPYEREHLADEIMRFDRNPVSSAYMTHVYQAREAARGAEGGSGGGCGCN